MMKVRNLGRKSLEEVKYKLEDLGLGLRKRLIRRLTHGLQKIRSYF